MSRKNANAEKKIHELRVKVKRLRALLRLRRYVEPNGMQELNRELQKLGRALAKSRDGSVCAKWLRKHGLSQCARQNLSNARLRRLEEKIEMAQRKVLQVVCSRMADVSIKKEALEESIRKMQESRRKALRRRSDESFHEWRKRVKDLLYQIEFLGISKPQIRLRKLGHQLGLAHDCTLAEDFIKTHPEEYKRRHLKIAKREKRACLLKAIRIDADDPGGRLKSAADRAALVNQLPRC